MVTARLKTPDKNEVCKKVLTLLKKTYTDHVLKPELPVLETLLYGICLENCTVAQADELYGRLQSGFHDLNEVRVSSIFELEDLFEHVDEPEWKALRVKNSLQYVFESTYSFDFEGLKRKTIELATKQLGKIKSLSPFVRSFVLQNSLGSHVLPIDQRMHLALAWLGLVDAHASPDAAGEALRPFVRKADAQQFCLLVRWLATDARLMPGFVMPTSPEDVDNLASTGVARLEHLLRNGPTLPKKEAPRKVSAGKLTTTVKPRAAEPPAETTPKKPSNGARKPAPAKDPKVAKPQGDKGTKKVVTAKQSDRPAAKKKPK